MALRIAATNTVRKFSAAASTPAVQNIASASNDYMSTMEKREQVLDWFAEHRATAVLRTATSEACPAAMQAAIDGGFKIGEFTLTTPDCLDHLNNFRAKYDGAVSIGCGTILTIDDAKDAIDAGAEFIITPVLVTDVVEWCAARNIVIIPGCQTPTELVTAYRAGAPLQKLFPGVVGGATWIKAVSSALPFLSINPTSGVDLENAGEILKNGAASVGLVAPLFDPVAIANNDWDQIQKNAEKVIAKVKEAGPYQRK